VESQHALFDQDREHRADRGSRRWVGDLGLDLFGRRLAARVNDLHDLSLASAQVFVGHHQQVSPIRNDPQSQPAKSPTRDIDVPLFWHFSESQDPKVKNLAPIFRDSPKRHKFVAQANVRQRNLGRGMVCLMSVFAIPVPKFSCLQSAAQANVRQMNLGREMVCGRKCRVQVDAVLGSFSARVPRPIDHPTFMGRQCWLVARRL
jgi:hypothetical protein